jgi:hypothetical protein
MEKYYLMFYIIDNIPFYLGANGKCYNVDDNQRISAVKCMKKISYNKINKLIQRYIDFLGTTTIYTSTKERYIFYGYVTLEKDTMKYMDLVWGIEPMVGKVTGMVMRNGEVISKYDNCDYDTDISSFNEKDIKRIIKIKSIL